MGTLVLGYPVENLNTKLEETDKQFSINIRKQIEKDF